MKKALCTLAVGPLKPLLRYTLSPMQAYCELHGYDLINPDEDWFRDVRYPPSWWKIEEICRTLEDHDLVLWLDSDILIVDGSKDIADELVAPLPDLAYSVVKFSQKETWRSWRDHPNAGMMVCTSIPVMRRMAELAHSAKQPEARATWEQPGLWMLTGIDLDWIYDSEHRGTKPRPPMIPDPNFRFQELDRSWNRVLYERDITQGPLRFAHYCGATMEKRMQLLAENRFGDRKLGPKA